MNTLQSRRVAFAWLHKLSAIGLGLYLVLVTVGCGEQTAPKSVMPKAPPIKTVQTSPGGTYHLDLFKAEPRPGIAVVILVDTSGSMNQAVNDRGGKQKPKYQIARDALENIVQNTDRKSVV
jgi:hypothetical protein